MKVAQIAEFLNDVKGEYLGENTIISEDLSNFVDFGRAFTATATNDDTDRFMKKLGDKCAKQIFSDREYKAKLPFIVRDGAEWGSVVEKTRIKPRDFEDNFVWELEAGEKYDEFLTFKPNDALVKYYNSKVTYRIPLEISRKQVRESMINVDSFVRFVNALEVNVANQLEMAYEIMGMRLVNGMIAHRAKNNKEVKLLTLFNSTRATADQITINDVINGDPAFLRFAARTIMDYSSMLEKMSTKYNDGEIQTFTKKPEQYLTMLSIFDSIISTELYSQTYHDDFLRIAQHDNIPYWQATDANDTLTARSKIIAKPIGTDETATTVNNVVGILRDRDALAIFNFENDVTTFTNPSTRVTRYNYFNDMSLFADTSENFVVFTLN
ncbi:MAG: hypothetical protein IJY79_09290 [Clostridia bacterium]|nr:hypothetical protein [Clostridia bacterium]MBQ8741725.1 hypothetical protein [Clostridia bacterium]